MKSIAHAIETFRKGSTVVPSTNSGTETSKPKNTPTPQYTHEYIVNEMDLLKMYKIVEPSQFSVVYIDNNYPGDYSTIQTAGKLNSTYRELPYATIENGDIYLNYFYRNEVNKTKKAMQKITYNKAMILSYIFIHPKVAGREIHTKILLERSRYRSEEEYNKYFKKDGRW